MEQALMAWLKLGQTIRDRTKELERLKAEKAELERQIIRGIVERNGEHLAAGDYRARVSYVRSYRYDLPVIRKTLEPRRLFDTVATTRINNDEFTTVISTPGLLTEAEFEDMLNAVTICGVRQILTVTKH